MLLHSTESFIQKKRAMNQFFILSGSIALHHHDMPDNRVKFAPYIEPCYYRYIFGSYLTIMTLQIPKLCTYRGMPKVHSAKRCIGHIVSV